MPVTAGRSPDARKAVDEAFALMWDVLTAKHGKCGHCGKSKCSGRKSWETIPDGARIPLEDIEEAVRVALKARREAAAGDIHEESRDGGRTWALVSTPASGQVDLVDGVMVRKAVTT